MANPNKSTQIEKPENRLSPRSGSSFPQNGVNPDHQTKPEQMRNPEKKNGSNNVQSHNYHPITTRGNSRTITTNHSPVRNSPRWIADSVLKYRGNGINKPFCGFGNTYQGGTLFGNTVNSSYVGYSQQQFQQGGNQYQQNHRRMVDEERFDDGGLERNTEYDDGCREFLEFDEVGVRDDYDVGVEEMDENIFLNPDEWEN